MSHVKLDSPGPVVALDVDGVLLDLLTPWRRHLEELVGPVNEDPRHYHLGYRFGIDDREIETVWDRFTRAGEWRSLELMPGVDEWIARLRDEGFAPLAVTNIPEGLRDERIENLVQRGIDMPVLPATNKAAACEAYGAVAFYDDYHLNIDQVAQREGLGVELAIPATWVETIGGPAPVERHRRIANAPECCPTELRICVETANTLDERECDENALSPA